MSKWEKKYRYELEGANLGNMTVDEQLAFIQSTLKEYADEVKKVVEDFRTVEPNSKYPDARWQRENYGNSQYNLAKKELRQALAKLNQQFGVEGKE